MMRVLPLTAVADQRFLPNENFGFVKTLGVVPVNDTEYHLTAHDLPLAVRLARGVPRLVAILDPGYLTRVIVDAEGRWRGGYMMIALRTHPFVLLSPEAARPIDEIGVIPGAGTIGPRGAAITTDASKGLLGPEVMAIRNTLQMMRQGSIRLSRALELLTISNVLVPLRDHTGEPSADLLTVDPARLAGLKAGAVAALASQSFLPLDLATAIAFSRRHLDAGHLPLPEARAVRPAEVPEPNIADPMDFVLANLEGMNFALDASDLFDALDFALDDGAFAPPASAAEAVRP